MPEHGRGARYRGIGTGEVVKWVQNSATRTSASTASPTRSSATGTSARSPITSAYGYITLNGVDPIFASRTRGGRSRSARQWHPAGCGKPACFLRRRISLPGKQDLGWRVLFPATSAMALTARGRSYAWLANRNTADECKDSGKRTRRGSLSRRSRLCSGYKDDSRWDHRSWAHVPAFALPTVRRVRCLHWRSSG